MREKAIFWMIVVITSKKEIQNRIGTDIEFESRYFGIDLFANFLDQVRQSDKKLEIKTNVNGYKNDVKPLDFGHYPN